VLDGVREGRMRKRAWGGVVAVMIVGAMALGTGAALHTGRRGGPITITVPGAMNLAVYCGGDDTSFADGPTITFAPEGPRCDIEAPLSAAMPLRARLELTGAADYQCDRTGIDLVCRAR
jgi:hypothetical protein